MKKKILSAFLVVALLLACMAPAAFAADTDIHDHDHDHDTVLLADTVDLTALQAAYTNASTAMYAEVTANGVTRTEAFYSILTAYETAKANLIAAGGSEDGIYDSLYNNYKAKFDELSTAAVSAYTSAFTSAYLEYNQNGASVKYTSYYNTAKSAYESLLASEKASLNTMYNFTNLTAPGSGSGSGSTATSGSIAAVEAATTYAEFSSAISAALLNLVNLSSVDQIKLTEAQAVLDFLSGVSSASPTISTASLGACGSVYYQYLGFDAYQQTLCANIKDIDVASFVSACSLASAYIALDNPTTDPSIVSIYSQYKAITVPTKYFVTGFETELYSSYLAYLSQSNVTVTGAFNTITSQATLSVVLAAGYGMSSATVYLDIEDTYFSSAWLNSVSLTNGTITYYDYSSGVLTVYLSNINTTQTTLTIVLNIPAASIGKTVNFTVSGYIGSGDDADQFTKEVAVSCCSHKVAGVLAYEQHIIKAATCSSGGVSGYFCMLCGTRLMAVDGAPSDEITVLPTAHIPGEKVKAGVTNVASTCTTNGIQYYECKDCYSVISKGITLPASHNPNVNTITWNASTNAWNATCSDCGVTYDISATKAKCTCEATYGKSYAKIIASKAATCGVTGYNAYECQLCGVSWVETTGSALTSHTWGAWTTTTAATCTTKGVQTRTCTVCGQTETQDIAAIAHNFDMSSYKVITAATCTTAGVASKTCSNCGLVETFSIAIKDHEYDEGVVTKEATCTETGVKTYTCKVCAITKTETIAINPDNHDLTTKVEKAATCVETGLEATTCSRCDYRTEKVLEESGHTWRIDEETDKVTKKTCVVCKTVWEQTTSKKGTTLSITAGNNFTLDIADSTTAEKDVEFSIEKVEFPEETVEWFDDFFDEGDYDASYKGAYTASLIVDGEKADVTKDMNLVIDLGEEYKKNEIFVVYVTDEGTPSAKVAVERDGSSIIISGEDYAKFADKTFVVMTSNDKVSSSPIVAIIICVAVVAIAGIAVVLVIKGSKGNKKKV